MKPLAVLLLVCITGCSTVGKPVAGIGNFAEVSPGELYRGAQPSHRGFETLAKMGVKTVINLRDDALPSEERDVKKAGLNYVHIPMNASRVEPAKVREALEAIATQPRPLFVHCKAGCDRTGLSVALFRMTAERWTTQAAVAELYAHGYHWALFPGIANYLRRPATLADYKAQSPHVVHATAN